MIAEVLNFIQTGVLPFVRRESTDYIFDAFSTISISQGRRILLLGENGVGKTRLLNEIIKSSIISELLIFRIQFTQTDSTKKIEIFNASTEPIFEIDINEHQNSSQIIAKKLLPIIRTQCSVLLIDEIQNLPYNSFFPELKSMLDSLENEPLTIILSATHLPSDITNFFNTKYFEIFRDWEFGVDDIELCWKNLFKDDTRPSVYKIIQEESKGYIGLISTILRTLILKKIIYYHTSEKLYAVNIDDNELRMEVEKIVDSCAVAKLLELNTTDKRVVHRLSSLGNIFSEEAANIVLEDDLNRIDTLVQLGWLSQEERAKPIMDSEITGKIYRFNSNWIYNYLTKSPSVRPSVLIEILALGLPVYSYQIFETLLKLPSKSFSLHSLSDPDILQNISNIIHRQFIDYYKLNLLRTDLNTVKIILKVYENIISIMETINVQDCQDFKFDLHAHKITVSIHQGENTDHGKTGEEILIFHKSNSIPKNKIQAIAKLQVYFLTLTLKNHLSKKIDFKKDIVSLCLKFELFNHPSFLRCIRSYLYFLTGSNNLINILEFEKYMNSFINALEEKGYDIKVLKDNYIPTSTPFYILNFNSKKEAEIRHTQLNNVLKKYGSSENRSVLQFINLFYSLTGNFRSLYESSIRSLNDFPQTFANLKLEIGINRSAALLGLQGNVACFNIEFDDMIRIYTPYNFMEKVSPGLNVAKKYIYNFVVSNETECNKIAEQYGATGNYFNFLATELKVLLIDTLPNNERLVALQILTDKSLDNSFIEFYFALKKRDIGYIKSAFQDILNEDVYNLGHLMRVKVMLSFAKKYELIAEASLNKIIPDLLVKLLKWLKQNYLSGFMKSVIQELSRYDEKEALKWTGRMKILSASNSKWLQEKSNFQSQKFNIKVIGKISITNLLGDENILKGKSALLIALLVSVELLDRKPTREVFANLFMEKDIYDKGAFRDLLKIYLRRIKDKTDEDLILTESPYHKLNMDIIEIDALSALNHAKQAIKELSLGFPIRAVGHIENCFNYWKGEELFLNIEGEFFENIRAQFEITIHKAVIETINSIKNQNIQRVVKLLNSAILAMPENQELRNMYSKISAGLPQKQNNFVLRG